ncbi:dsDNA nuclease domain-containing protein [Rufibacter tibetensis]|uniref:CD-NTase associated protein 4-like DNA endonuclease domain-containing protein n=1 Tax=Rufibacter tibetensis TaxID=512763 RepID=A0A0P0CAL5_9BACT|nr:dsDNA nuclease domain-containing protein [Rufibacter tibetensis]ALI98574.1 hypothetical protein DC20_05815 [Rufibacter tibetensis]
MGTNKLYLFSKDTGATATEQGYHYQKLKTLKTWLENRIADKDDVIFCDYEDDIFQRNFKEGTVKFRQIKLYSSNFSFSTEEIAKSIFNFFMLFTKGEYLFDEATFVFETNSSIAREIRGNNANLLREWNAHQENMSAELLGRCVVQVKTIIDEFIKEGYARNIAGDATGDFQQAKKLYDNLPDAFWQKFVVSIRWRFEAIAQEKAIPGLLEEIESLIMHLPVSIKTKQATTYLAVLHYEIAKRTAEPDEKERMLTNDLLDVIALNEGSEKDKWYAAVFAKWSGVTAINTFTIGAFYELIDATRYCRWNIHGSAHAGVWLRLLRLYIVLPETIIVCKRKAIYEYLFLKVSICKSSSETTGPIVNEVDLINFYFNNFEERNTLADIEEDISLLQIIMSQSMLKQDFLNTAIIKGWREKISSYIDEKLASPRDIDEHCLLLELKGSTLLQLNRSLPKFEKVTAALEVYRQIIPLLEQANLYTITKLSDLLNQIIELYINFGVNDDAIDAIETFLSEIADQAAQTGRQHIEAHNFVERGVAYLNKGGSKNFLRALDCFHKSAKLWLLNDTKDGYILALINIAQLYAALGANFAGKYYGLCGIWSAFNFGDPKSLKRVSDSYAMVFHSDYKQGAWMSALNDFLNFLNARQHFDPQGLNGEKLLVKSFLDLALMVESAERLNPELVHFINFYKQNLGSYYSQDMQYVVAPLQNALQEMADLKEFISTRIEDQPFNDLGTERIIRFKMVGAEWRVKFENSMNLTGIAEEFCALLQVTLCEIGLSGTALNIQPEIITITIEESRGLNNIIEQIGHSLSAWKLKLPLLNVHDPSKVKVHYAYMAVNIKMLLTNLSSLNHTETESLFDTLYRKQRLGDKGLGPTSYQRAFFSSCSQEDFDASQRNNFQTPSGRFDIVLHDNFVGNTSR